VLLGEVGSATYARLLSQALPLLRDDGTFQLWPQAPVASLWSVLAKGVFQELQHNHLPVLIAERRRSRLPLDQAVVLVEKQTFWGRVTDGGLAWLVDVLDGAGEQVVCMPEKLWGLLEQNLGDERSARKVTPALVRQVLAARFPRTAKGMEGKLLAYCCEDLKPTGASQLTGLQLLPLVDGTYGQFAMARGETYLLADSGKMTVLLPTHSARLVDVKQVGTPVQNLVKEFSDIPGANVQRVSVEDLARLLPELLPGSWRLSAQQEVEAKRFGEGASLGTWLFGGNGSEEPYSHLNEAWVQNLWQCLGKAGDLAAFTLSHYSYRRE
jgi:hypothetical protein